MHPGLFFSPFLSFIWLNPGKHRGWLMFWSSAVGSALQTAPCSSQGRRDVAHHPLSPKLLFFLSLDGVKNEHVWFLWTRRWGSPGEPEWGGDCSFWLPAGRICYWQPKNRLVRHSQQFLSTRWETPNMLRDNTSRGRRKTIISQEGAWDTAREKPDLDHFLA